MAEKKVKVEALRALNIPGKGTVEKGSIVELDSAVAEALTKLKKPAVKTIEIEKKETSK